MKKKISKFFFVTNKTIVILFVNWFSFISVVVVALLLEEKKFLRKVRKLLVDKTRRSFKTCKYLEIFFTQNQVYESK